MKKIFISTFLILIFSAKAFAADYYLVGIDAYKKGAYDKAAANLEHAIRINPKNVNARYYLAQTYLMQKKIPDATNQYKRILILAPNSDAGILSQKGLYLISKSTTKDSYITSTDLFARYKDNYIDFVIPNDGNFLKWAAFPLNVYIEPKAQKLTAQKAFEQWQAKSNNLVTFNFVPTEQNAQIKVAFKDKLETSVAGEGFIAGYSKPYGQNDKMTMSEISILTADPKIDEKLNYNSIYAATLHEIGHSLGFRGHSPSAYDIMSATASAPKMELTQRDLNTLNIFYKTDKKTLLTRGRGQTDVQLQQALDYVKKTPDKAVGWGNLGDIYRSKKMYAEAVKNYQKAIAIEPKADFYNLIGTTYMEMGNTKDAFVNLKKSCDMEKSNEFYLYQFADFCLTHGQKEVGRNYVNSYIMAYPQRVSDEKIQRLLMHK